MSEKQAEAWGIYDGQRNMVPQFSNSDYMRGHALGTNDRLIREANGVPPTKTNDGAPVTTSDDFPSMVPPSFILGNIAHVSDSPERRDYVNPEVPLVSSGAVSVKRTVYVQKAPSDIDATLTERGKRYGKFQDQAYHTWRIKSAMGEAVGWDRLDYDMKEALDMIASKIARILNGDPNYTDNWHDIAGYATLVEKRLKGDAK